MRKGSDNDCSKYNRKRGDKHKELILNWRKNTDENTPYKNVSLKEIEKVRIRERNTEKDGNRVMRGEDI